MPYTPPPIVTAGTRWKREDFNRYVVENIRELYGLLSATGSTLQLDENNIVIGGSDGRIRGLEVGNGHLIIGSPAGVTTLAPGADGTVLKIVNKRPSWVVPAFTPDPAVYLIL